MPRIAPFEARHERYDSWFERHEAAYYSELLAVLMKPPVRVPLIGAACDILQPAGTALQHGIELRDVGFDIEQGSAVDHVYTCNVQNAALDAFQLHD